jgi:hypothetical protein
MEVAIIAVNIQIYRGMNEEDIPDNQQQIQARQVEKELCSNKARLI